MRTAVKTAPSRQATLNLPIGLTLLRILLVPVLVTVLLTRSEASLPAGLLVFSLAVATDYLDGHLARRLNQVTRLGILLDPIADKLLTTAAFLALVDLGTAPAWMVMIILGRELAVTALRNIAAGRGLLIAPSALGKGKMVVQVVAVFLLLLSRRYPILGPLGYGVLWLALIAAIVSAVDYFQRFWRETSRDPRAPDRAATHQPPSKDPLERDDALVLGPTGESAWKLLILTIVLPLAVGITGCGEHSPAGPTLDAQAEADFPAGTVISIVSGETGAPVAGASLLAGDRQLESDAAGRVTLAERLDAKTAVDVVAAGYLDRLTRLRSREPIELWPARSPTGLDERYSATLVYTSTSDRDAPLAGDPLYRLGSQTRQVYLVPGAELQADSASMEALEDAAARIGTASAGQVVYSVTKSPPAGAVRFDVRLDASASNCEGARAFTSRSLRGTEIVGGSITFCSLEASRGATATHEVGHTFGFRHGPDARDVMYRSNSPMRAVDFSAREALAARLMLLRPPGNRWPDNDRDVTAAASRGIETIVCRW